MKNLLYLLIFLVCPVITYAQKLQPKQINIRSEVQSPQIHPKVGEHLYDPRRPAKSMEPYSPNFQVKDYEFPENFVSNEKVHWLSKYTGRFASSFRGAQGSLERGIQLYRNENYKKAISSFLKARKNGLQPIKEEATLWLAWSYFKNKSPKKSYQLAQSIQNAEDNKVKAGAFYLSLAYLAQEQDEHKIYKTQQALLKRLPQKEWGFNLSYAYLACLVERSQWKEAKSFARLFETQGITHSRLYPKIKYVHGVIAYGAGDYQESLQAILATKKVDLRGLSQQENNRILAWLSYLTGDFQSALELTEQEIRFGKHPNLEELKYLEIAILVRQQQAVQLEKKIAAMNKASTFYQLASFQVRAFVKNLHKYPKLQKITSTDDLPFPELKFYVSLLEGHQAFTDGKIATAERSFLKALSVDTGSDLYWIAQYNMALVHLKKSEFRAAVKRLKALRRSRQPEDKKWLAYHLLYSYYSLDHSKSFLQLFKTAKLEGLEPEVRWQSHLMKGSLLFNHQRHQEALADFYWGWENAKKPVALGYAAQAHYQLAEYQKAIDLAQIHPKPFTEHYIRFQVKSYLALSNYKEAEAQLEQQHFKGETLLGLHIEVWQNTGQYNKIIQRVRPLIKNETNQGRKHYYYTLLGDAEFNRKNYTTSEKYYQLATDTATNSNERSQSLYNLAVAKTNNHDFDDFEKFSKKTLKRKDLSMQVRYRLTMLFSDAYREQKRTKDADWLLYKYTRDHSFEKAAAHMKRAKLQLAEENYTKCVRLARTPIPKLNRPQQRDLIILDLTCSLKSQNTDEGIRLAEENLREDSNPNRKIELSLLLAEAYLQNGRATKSSSMLQALQSMTLSKREKLQAQFLQLKIAVQKNPDKSTLSKFNDLTPYRSIGRYQEALQIKIRLQKKTGASRQAIKDLLRLYYRKGTSDTEKQSILLQLADLYQSRGEMADAKEYFSQVKEEAIQKSQIKTYLRLSKELR